MENLKELIKMPVIEERRVTLSGSSLIMTLPKDWIDEHNIKAGDKILIKANGHLEIRVRTDENLELMNNEVLSVRSQLANHITRSDG
jgi:phosphate uptake regulator